ncbi:hypothetical protein ABKN59_003029 [Abortiporus biennis]
MYNHNSRPFLTYTRSISGVLTLAIMKEDDLCYSGIAILFQYGDSTTNIVTTWHSQTGDMQYSLVRLLLLGLQEVRHCEGNKVPVFADIERILTKLPSVIIHIDNCWNVGMTMYL